MRMAVFLLVILLASFESFAQNRRGAPRGPNYNPPGRGPVITRPTPYPGRVVVRPTRPIGPRYWNPGSHRTYRPVFRPVIPRYTGLTCSYAGQLLNNGYLVHSFYYSQDCSLAIQDALRTGDFCDGADLYDISGIHEASFSSSYECRQMLGYYY